MAPHLQDGPLRFHPLAFLEDGGEVVVGRSDIDSYGVFPADGAALVRELAAGRAPADAADWYAETYGERIDMADFVATLHELQLVRSEQRARGRDYRTAFAGSGSAARCSPRRPGRCTPCCSPPPCWCARSTARMVPRTDNVFFTGSLVIVAVAVFAGQLALTLCTRCSTCWPAAGSASAAASASRGACTSSSSRRTSTGSQSSSAGGATCRSSPGCWPTRWPSRA